MGVHARAGPIRSEPDAHAMTRHVLATVYVLLALFLVATVIGLIFFPSVAYAAAIPIPILTVVLLVANSYEEPTRLSTLRGKDPSTITDEETRADEETTGLTTGLKIAGVLAVAALVLAASLFEWRVVGLMAVGIFLYMVFVGLPLWLAAVFVSEEDEHEKLTGESRGIR
ncbi:MAG: hypothetical protein KDC38_09650 [Planctomycetes bacterium]|nr:hypothetical protein [Planctomycetota bacterium]